MQFSPMPLGEALVFAYKEMGLDVLWQPLLRAETESQVSNIACGQVSAAAAGNLQRALPMWCWAKSS